MPSPYPSRSQRIQAVLGAMCVAFLPAAVFGQARTSPFPATPTPRAQPVEEARRPAPNRPAPVPRAEPVEEKTQEDDPPPVRPSEATTPSPPRGKPKETLDDDQNIPRAEPVPTESSSSLVPRQDVIPEGKTVPEGTVPTGATNPAKPDEPLLQASMRTQADARTLYVTLPAPRGLIVDRNGHPFAQNIIAYYPGIQFPEGAPLSPANALTYARQRITVATRVLGQPWTISDEDILKHYENRRWLPLLNERPLKQEPTAELKARLLAGIIFHPGYLRTYPEGGTACHVIGSVGKVRPMPITVLDPQDPFYPEMLGRDGIEAAYEEQLKGRAGQMNMLFDAQGHKISEEITQHPVPGNTVVTTMDLDFQQICEDALRSNVRPGAFVIIDVETGDVISLASWPTFNLNDWVPGISQTQFDAMKKDTRNLPLVPRAFQGKYPPASTFKIVTALAGLDSGKFTENSTFNCSSSLRLGNHIMGNAYKGDFGNIGLTQAIKMSCNTWFARAGMATGSTHFVEMAGRLGFGQLTGLPIKGEVAGIVANDDWMLVNSKRKLSQGDVANMAIGQGPVDVTPIQAARAMAAVANGEFTPDVRLVVQIQDLDDKVVEAFPPTIRNDLDISKRHIAAVHKGMRAVVNEGGGTGRAAASKYVTVAGKTGTAQWTGRNMAWFVGFLPANNPQYAFAAVYEGAPGESRVSGGGKVAPLVKTVFDRIYKLKKDRDEPFYKRSPDSLLAKADKDDENSDEDAVDSQSSRPASKPRVAAAASQPASQPAETPPPENRGVRGFFKRLFGGRQQ